MRARTGAAELPKPPERLRRHVVEDWLAAAGFRPGWVEEPGELGSWLHAAACEAHRRRMAARAAWLAEQGIADDLAACGVVSKQRPRFADEQAFAEALGPVMAEQQGEFDPGHSWRRSARPGRVQR